MGCEDLCVCLIQACVYIWTFFVLLICVPWLCIWFVLRSIVYALTCGHYGFPKNPDGDGNKVNNHFAQLTALVRRPSTTGTKMDDQPGVAQNHALGAVAADGNAAKIQGDDVV